MHCRTLVSFLVLLFVSTASGQVPELINFQGRLVDGSALVNGNREITLRLFDAEIGPAEIYAETQTVSVVDGHYTFPLGASNMTPHALSAALLSTSIWLEVTVASQTLAPRERLASVPYALTTRELSIDTNSAPNVVLAASGNTIGPNNRGVTISGGDNNDIGSNALHAVVGGGFNNDVGDDSRRAIIAGGFHNAIGKNAQYAVVSGGTGNEVADHSDDSTIGGGFYNTIGMFSDHATIAGGKDNVIGKSSSNSTVGGGNVNSVSNSSFYATIAGGRNNHIGMDSDYSTIGGGENNNVSSNAHFATIAGGQGNDIGTNTSRSTVGGGAGNLVSANCGYATIAGGIFNIIGTNSDYSAVGGGRDNTVAEEAQSATIAGGRENDIGPNADFAVVGGGTNNNVGVNSSSATIAGGDSNDIGANSVFATVSGGGGNDVANSSGGATLAGGLSNDIGSSSAYSTVGGGWFNLIGDNSPYAVIPGGQSNEIGDDAPYAFSAGRRAKANHPGSFVWADSLNSDFPSTTNDQFLVRAAGGVGINTVSPRQELDVNGDVQADRFLAGDGSAGSVAIGFSGDTNTGIFTPSPNGNTIAFATGGTEQMRISNLGYVGIGTTSPEQNLHVVHRSTPVIIDRVLSEGALIRFRQDGMEEGSITVSGNTVSYNNFTGSHAAWSEHPVKRAMLVTLTGNNRRLHGHEQSEIVYGVKVTQRANDPAVLGAYLAPTEPGTPFSLDNPHLVMASGNGQVWVADTGQDIQPGDYLVSAHVPGHAMVDDRAGAQSHIIGRAGEGVEWSEVTDAIEGTKHQKISILFDAFVRDNSHAGSQLAQLQAENDALQKRMVRLEESLSLFAQQNP